MYTNTVTNHAVQQAKLEIEEIEQLKSRGLERHNFSLFFALEDWHAYTPSKLPSDEKPDNANTIKKISTNKIAENFFPWGFLSSKKMQNKI